MEWLVYLAPVPASVDINVGGGAAIVAAVAALAPLVLVLRRFVRVRPSNEVPQLRLVEGRKQLPARAA